MYRIYYNNSNNKNKYLVKKYDPIFIPNYLNNYLLD